MLKIITEGRRYFLRKLGLAKEELLELTIKNGNLVMYKNFGGFQTRAESTLKMFLDCLTDNYREDKLNKKIVIHIGDFPKKEIKRNHFYYCVEKKENLGHVIPDFIFDKWPQAGIFDFDTLTKKIKQKGDAPYQISKMLWIGNSNTHFRRKKFLEIAQENTHFIEAYNTAVDRVLGQGESLPYISLEDHTKYKYLIDIEGNGYSGRLGLLLFTQRVLFIQDRKWKQYYYFDLKPYEHFIPVKNDFSDLLQQIQYVESQGEDFYKMLTLNALRFAEENLTYEKAIQKIKQVIY